MAKGIGPSGGKWRSGEAEDGLFKNDCVKLMKVVYIHINLRHRNGYIEIGFKCSTSVQKDLLV